MRLDSNRLLPTLAALAVTAAAASLIATAACADSSSVPEAATVPEAAASSSSPESFSPEPFSPPPDAPDQPDSPDRPGAAVRELTGGPARVVWVQDSEEGRDPFAQGTRLRLMGLDTEDGDGERAIVAELGSYAKPIITPDGTRIVYSNRPEDAVYVVDWDGSNHRRIGGGFGLAVWRDADGVEWVYIGQAYDESDFPPYAPVHRVRLDDPSVREVAWESPPIAEDNFQLSIDGRRASGAYPWPHCGIGDLESRAFDRKAEGCWPDLSPDNNYLLWVFDGSHRNLIMFAPDRDARWTVNINSAPGLDGSEVYHPRWSNHPRVFAVTGPYTVGDRANKIRGGGTGVEILVGRFNRAVNRVEAWARATDNAKGDFYPDVWVDPSTVLSPIEVRPPGSARPAAGAAPAPDSSRRVVVEARLVDAAAVPTPESIAPYRAGLLVNTYRVEQVIEGEYDGDRLMAAHWVIRDGEVLPTAEREQGRLYRMTLEPYDDHPELEGQRLVMDTDDFDLDLYYDTGS